MRRIYLDHNATTPLAPEVIEAMTGCLSEVYGNPSSLHSWGLQARRALDLARGQVARALNAKPGELVFTSGGTEANNHAIRGAALGQIHRGRHLITSAIEHPAALEVFRALREEGFRVDLLPVTPEGRIRVELLPGLLREDTTLVSLMLANNEVGSLQPVSEAATLVRPRGALLHCDAVQALGKVPLDVRGLGVDLLSVSGHKINGPKGSGALYLRAGLELPPLLRGGHQEGRRRGGTVNLPAQVGFGAACELLRGGVEQKQQRLRGLRDRFEEELLRRLPEARVNGSREPGARLPNTSNLRFPGVNADLLLLNLDALGLAASAASACTAGSGQASHVLQAMGLDELQALNCLRFSFGQGNTLEEVDEAVERVVQAVAQTRALFGL